ncbi:MAG TPA: type IV pilus twitching motility protein PilT [Patescibacteria group bacterium]|nr:type IV pilus twitching motility protein PilT [Patescibacteria group bacterium]
MEIEKLLEITFNKGASDLHLITKVPPMLRIHGVLSPITGLEPLSKEVAEQLIFSLVSEEQKEILLVNKELDFSFAFGDRGRFRVNAYYQKGELAAALRLISMEVPTIDELNLPDICHAFTKLKQGFILVVGPTGHGKSTTLASIIEEINLNRSEHIITIEDPIEYVFKHQKSIVSQRELRDDTHSWSIALRSCLREDPNVVMIGEMRDLETMGMALTIAETGHLVFSTLHTNSAAQSIDRIIDVFPEHQQEQVRMQLSATLEAIVSQRLLPSLEGGRIPATEVLVATPAIRTVIREGKTHMIDNIIQTSVEVGMKVLEMDLSRLVKEGKISLDVARNYAFRPEELMKSVKGR